MGFSLVELITVVVVLSLLAVIGTGFVVSATESYQSTQTRALLANTGRQGIERMTRQLRGALPYSVRVTNSGHCVQFLPLAGGGYYRDPVPDQANQANEHTDIQTVPHQADFGQAVYLTVGAMASDELYGSDAVSRTSITDRTETQINFAPRSWERNSLSQRFYLLDEPEAFCLFDRQLRYYPGQDITASAVDPDSDFDLLARNAQAAGTPFELSSASENRNVVLAMNIGFTEGGETVTFEQEVLIRNVP